MELRKDYILDRWVYYSPERKKRPKEYRRTELEEKSRECFFCPGNEKLTPPEIGRTGKKKWKIRWFNNKFPAVFEEGNTKTITEKKFLMHSAAYGKHEVIVETDKHNRQLWDLSEKDILDVLKVYGNRIEELQKRRKIRYVLVFKNHGLEGGTSIIHTHSQVTATSVIPPLVQEEIKCSKKYGRCPYCGIVKLESKSKRKCFENKTFVSFAPYASRFHYENWIFPKRHIRNISNMKESEFKDLASIMKKALLKLRKLAAGYNFFLHYSPEKENLHFHIEITPRDSTWAGFELGSGAVINSVMPETAAEFYRK